MVAGHCCQSGIVHPGGISSGWNQLENSPKDYGQGWNAYGNRFGNNFLTYSLQDSASQALAASAGYEMRYIQCKCTGVMPRIGHAILYNFVTYNREGRTVFNWPSLAGGYAIGMLSTQYTPNQKWSAEGIRAGTSAIYFGFASSLLQEFMPSKLFAKHPKKISTAPAAQSDPSANPPKLSSQ